MMPDDLVFVQLSESDYRFIVDYNPERERSANRKDLVAVIEEIQALVIEGRFG